MKEAISKSAATARRAPNAARRQRLLDAAERVFSRVGYRAVTMAAIAAEAGLAKATVYAYFADKDDVFRCVGEALAARLVAAVETALATPGGTAQRIAAALVAKDSIILELITTSAHAGELFEARDRLVRDAFDGADRAILALVTAALDDGVARNIDAPRFARMLVRASRGLAARVEHAAGMAADIEYLVVQLVEAARRA